MNPRKCLWSTKTPIIVTPKDKNYSKYEKQLKKDGFCDPECWNLDQTLSEFLLPRLRRFKNITHGYPSDLTEEEWHEILNKIIASLEWNIQQFSETAGDPPKTYQEGFDLLGKWFTSLWD